MRSNISTILGLPPAPRIAPGSLWRHHIDSLPDEIVRLALAYLDARNLRRAARVCVRWHALASSLLAILDREHRAAGLPWNILKHVLTLLDLCDLRNAAQTCLRWRFIAYGFFSFRLERRHINDIPAELIDYIFSFLDFESLRIAAQVCVRWRDQGIDHPIFWRNIEVKSATFGSLELLAARLGQSDRRPFSLTIDIEGLYRLVETKLMNLITAIMPTVQKLHIRLDSFYILSLWPVLNHPAPQLTSFYLKLYCPGRVMDRIPLNPWIFDNFPGKLEDVCIEDVPLPEETPGFPAFTNLRTLQLRYAPGSLSPFPVYLFENCPSLRHFSIFTGSFEYGQIWSKAALEGLARLVHLEVVIDSSARDEFVARLPRRVDIPIISMPTPPDFDAAYDFLAGLRQPFNFALSLVGETLNVIVQDDRSGYTRIFYEPASAYLCEPESNPATNILFDNERFPAQVQFLKMSLPLWDVLVPYLSHYASVSKLIIDLELISMDASGIKPLAGRPLEFSALETLVLETTEDYTFVSVDHVVRFVDDVLHARRCRLLELRRVHLRGWDVTPIDRRFDLVIYSNQIYTGNPNIRRVQI